MGEILKEVSKDTMFTLFVNYMDNNVTLKEFNAELSKYEDLDLNEALELRSMVKDHGYYKVSNGTKKFVVDSSLDETIIKADKDPVICSSCGDDITVTKNFETKLTKTKFDIHKYIIGFNVHCERCETTEDHYLNDRSYEVIFEKDDLYIIESDTLVLNLDDNLQRLKVGKIVKVANEVCINDEYVNIKFNQDGIDQIALVNIIDFKKRLKLY